ncbi:MAG TPA: thioredoxin domain-containing protein, partial [Lachnospiraceae bacterium]|nr:thioredoxin domain-containing protein [Lachnospiraceae bacterium]
MKIQRGVYMSGKFHFSPRENRAHEINWREWGEEAFKEAKEKEKLVLLSISAVWCHWCHVMDEISYSYKPNINFINDEFIPIRVDNDKNPDINKRYNMGGWPTTVILTPKGEILDGSTYMPDKTLYSFLAKTSRYYRLHKRKGSLINKKEMKNTESTLQKTNDINEEILTNIDKAIDIHFDSHFGGFGVEPKFFNVETLDYLIFRCFNKKEDMFKMIIKTLDAMANGAIHDDEEGGFFRYSTTRDWSIPHYEKMLEDNAKLLDIYLKMFQLTSEGKYENTAIGIIKYMNNNLLDTKSGAFYGSQAADEYYYSLAKEDRRIKVAPLIDNTIYTDWNAMAISAYTRAYYVLKDANFLSIAQRAATFLIKNCFNEEHGMYHYYINQAQK